MKNGSVQHLNLIYLERHKRNEFGIMVPNDSHRKWQFEMENHNHFFRRQIESHFAKQSNTVSITIVVEDCFFFTKCGWILNNVGVRLPLQKTLYTANMIRLKQKADVRFKNAIYFRIAIPI